MRLMRVRASAPRTDSAMAGNAMASGLWAAPRAFGLLLWFGRLLGGAGNGRVLSFDMDDLEVSRFSCLGL